MDIKVIRRLLHDLELMQGNNKRIELPIGATLSGADRKELQEPFTLTNMFNEIIWQCVKNTDLICAAKYKIREEVERQRDLALNRYNECDYILQQFFSKKESNEEEKEQQP